MAKVYLTIEAKIELENRLKYLKTVGRADASDKIRQAREFGDISENAEYDIAKDEQAKMESEIADIESKLANVEIIDENQKSDVVTLGSTVKILDKVEKSEDTYKIVGSTESNPMEGRISNESPIGRALLGKKKGDIVVVDMTATGGPKSEFKVISVG